MHAQSFFEPFQFGTGLGKEAIFFVGVEIVKPAKVAKKIRMPANPLQKACELSSLA